MNSVTRLAPSPTGALHLGNARTFLVNWLLARQRGWRIRFRIEDLDGPRIKIGADAQMMEDLHWLGIDWDDNPIRQSDRASRYATELQRLLHSGLAYPCTCSRKEAQAAASAPHGDEPSAVYPGTCRDRWKSVEEALAASGRAPAIRFRVPAGEQVFVDRFAGPQRFESSQTQGDFVIYKADQTAAYQLAVVVDDHDFEITEVVRGDDLLDSTPRQMLLYEALGWSVCIPSYTHLPLVIGPDGRRLAKRHGDTRLSRYRDAGVPADRVRALLARWYGIDAGDAVDHPGNLLKHFDLSRIPRGPIVMTPQDDAWLLRAAR